MSTLVLRSVKGSPLTSAEIDANVTNLNTDKADKASPTFTGTVTLPNSLLQVTASSYPTVQPTLNLDFANTKLLDPRITFVRNSTAAYYDGQTTAKAEENLLAYSQDFRTATTPWSFTAATSTQSAGIAPDGTNTLNLLIEDTSLGIHSIGKSINGISGAYTVSWFLQGNTRTYACVIISTDSYAKWYSVLINLSTGALVSSQSQGLPVGTSYSIQAYGSAYRVSVTATNTSGVVFCRIALSDSSTPAFTNTAPVYTGDGTSSIYVWGAQLEQRSSVTAYTKTTTAAITNYIPVLMTAPAGVARFDCDPITGKSLGLLIEESRTNLLTYSSDFNATWSQANTTIVADTTIAPDGALAGDSIINTATSSQHYIFRNVSIAANATYTTSVYLKALGTTPVATIWLLNAVTADRALVYVTLATGAVATGSAGGSPFTSVSASATSVGDGWSRITLTCTTTGGAINLQTRIFTNDTSTFTGDGYSGIYIWGAQLEAGSFATSHIPTVASTVTRAADQASMTGTNFSSWYNQAQGSFYAEFDATNITSTTPICAIDNGAVNGYMLYKSNAGLVAYVGASSANIKVGLSINTAYKGALSYSQSILACADGGAVSTSITATAINPNKLSIGGYWYSGSVLSGHIKKLTYYPIALSSANLVALTS